MRGCAASARIRRPSSAFVPSRRTTIGTRASTRSSASRTPLRHQVAPGDASEDVHEHDLHGGIGQHDLERRGHLVGRRAAADVEEVRGPRARLGHDVERGHHEPGAVADDAHVSVELHVLQALLLRACLHVVDRELIGQLGDVRVTPQGVVVDRHLRVERDDPVVLEEDQRVDLDEGRVPLDRELVHLPEHVARPFPRLDRQRADELAHVVRPEAEQRIDVDAAEGLGSRTGELLDVHPALGGHHREVVTTGAIEQERRVELSRDRQQLLDEDARHGEPLERGADHPVGGRGGRLRRLAQLHPAALAAAADLHLDLDDRPTAELLRRRGGLVPAECDEPPGRRDALGAEQVLAHVLVEIHRAPWATPVRPSRSTDRGATWRCHRCSPRA